MDYTNVLPVGHWRNRVSINQSVLGQIKKKIKVLFEPILKYNIFKMIMLATEEIFTGA